MNHAQRVQLRCKVHAKGLASTTTFFTKPLLARTSASQLYRPAREERKRALLTSTSSVSRSARTLCLRGGTSSLKPDLTAVGREAAEPTGGGVAGTVHSWPNWYHHQPNWPHEPAPYVYRVPVSAYA